MIPITSEEAARLRSACPQAVIAVTGRQAPHRKKNYYAEESPAVLQVIGRLRGDMHSRTASAV